MTKILTIIKLWAKTLKDKLVILYLALHHKDTPWYAKALIFLIIAYALSPIDLIPDFIPILGYLDDFILLPVGIYLAFKLIPLHVKEECNQKAQGFIWNKKKSLIGAIIISVIWSLILIKLLGIFLKG